MLMMEVTPSLVVFRNFERITMSLSFIEMSSLLPDLQADGNFSLIFEGFLYGEFRLVESCLYWLFSRPMCRPASTFVERNEASTGDFMDWYVAYGQHFFESCQRKI